MNSIVTLLDPGLRPGVPVLRENLRPLGEGPSLGRGLSALRGTEERGMYWVIIGDDGEKNAG